MATKSIKAVSKPAAPRMSAQDRKWQAESDLRIIQCAEQVRSDPKRMAAAQKEAASQMSALASVAKGK